MNQKKIAMRVSVITIIVNVVLTAFKLIAGIVGNSSAMVSDAVHSASDVLSTFAVMIGINLAHKHPDKKHQYGHERIECITAILLAVILAVTGIGIGYSAVQKLLTPEQLMPPSFIALLAAIISIVTKEWMFRYTKINAKKVNSGALMADAWHHRSDALSSIGSLVGIGGAMLGFPILDPIASIVICFFILKAAFDITKDSVSKLLDTSCEDCTVKQIEKTIMAHKDVINIDSLKTRTFASKIYIDLEISVDQKLTVVQSHDIAQQVHDDIEKSMPEVKHCMIHVNPYFEKA